MFSGSLENRALQYIAKYYIIIPSILIYLLLGD